MGLGTVVISPLIEVVMPTYNGVLFIEEQISSIFQQTLRPYRLLVRDDGSTDGTLLLLERLKLIYGSWLVIMSCGLNKGCKSSINSLLSHTTADYVALSDQDDVWLVDKMELAYAEIIRAETQNGKEVPILIHTDLKIVGSNLEEYYGSFMCRQHLDPFLNSPHCLALTNIVTGCTMLINRPLINKALPIPSQALVHDWWIALVASVFGKIIYIPISTILYRQHSNNLIGAKGLGFNYWSKRLYQWLFYSASGSHTLDAISQINVLQSRYQIRISILPSLISLSKIERIRLLISTPLSAWPHKHGVLRTLAFYCWLLRY